ncbi:MAG: leucine-rich repeat protein [Clostridia bacterium]|nr:leucine-rich repeat protein [Clostridia bacterium]
MKKTVFSRTLSLILTLTAVFGLFIFSPAASAARSGGWEYEVENGEATITGYHGSDWRLEIPSEIGGYPVTGIGAYAFRQTRLYSVAIPDGVTVIGDYAFWGCTALTSVTVPESLTSIGKGAFRDCAGLADDDGFIIFRNILSYYLGPGGFVVIPDGVTSIAGAAFAGCKNLTGVEIPESVTEIGSSAFSSCDGLINVKIGSGVKSIGSSAFHSCRSLTGVTIPEGVTDICDWAFSGCTSLTSVTIPDSVTNIGDYAFIYCESLTSMTIPDSVASFGDGAFRDCTGLADDDGFVIVGNILFDYVGPGGYVTIPSNVTRISDSVFSERADLTGVYIPSGVTDIDGWAFNGCSGLKSIKLPGGLKEIGADTFGGCTGITHLIIPDSLNYLDWLAFNSCSGIKSVTIPSGVNSTGVESFSGCTGLESVIIREGVTEIGNGCFENCYSLETVAIPASVTRIEDFAFYDCLALSDVYYGGTSEQWDEIYIGSDNEALFRYVTVHFGSAPHVHGYIAEVTEPTCTEKGYTTHTCKVCGEAYVDSEVAALGHAFGEWTVKTAPTCTAKGVEERVCSRCGEKETRDADALGHDLGADGNAEKCSRCGEKNPDYKPPVNFTDVKPGAYYADAVAWAVAKGVTTGTSATTFSPNDGCTRGQVVAFLWRAAGSPEPKGTGNPFSDVKSNAYYYKAVLWAVENEVTSGTDATHFSPNSVCTRGQIVTFLWRANGKPSPAKTSNPFMDVKASDYYYDAVLWAVEKDITLGTDATHFSPSSTCTRGQVVAFLYRAMA